MPETSRNADSPWPHRLALLLVCATFPVIWVGGLVTTYEAGMAVPDWPSTYGFNLFLYPWKTWVFGPWNIFVEHGHRLLAALAGMFTIALVVLTHYREPRAWVRWFAWLALLAVCSQGVLGGLRVLLDQRLLAKIHACTGPAFFAMAVGLACVTSKWWKSTARMTAADSGSWQRTSLIVTALAYLQIVLGAQLRHVSVGAHPRAFQVAVVFHILVGLMLAGVIWISAIASWRQRRRMAEGNPQRAVQGLVHRPVAALAKLIALQLSLGAGTWIMNYGWPRWFAGLTWSESHLIVASGGWQSIVTTAHVAIGSLIFATSVMWTLRTWRLWEAPSARAPRWQGDMQTWGGIAL